MKLLLIISGVLFFLGQDCKNSKHSTQTNQVISDSVLLDGNWELNDISATGRNFDSLFHDKKPTISFNLATSKFAGNTSCNNFNGPLKTSGNTISFKDPFAMTRMACPGDGEKVFLETLNMVDKFTVTNKNTLNFIAGDVAVMKFSRK
jgi:heat shock protein HslJ